ncbi:MAG: SdrD B-like domain-containing protein [Pirellulales bacterium]
MFLKHNTARSRKCASSTRRSLLRRLRLESLEDRRVMAPLADTSLSLPASAMLGSSVSMSVVFDNTATNLLTNTGYGPYVDAIFPNAGADGDDGLTFQGVTANGLTLSPLRVTFDAFGQAIHPFAVTGAGAPLVVNHPDGAAGAGDELVVVMLPFGSFTPTQTPVTLNYTATLSDLADLDQPLPVTVIGGYRYGATELDDPLSDPPIRGAADSALLTPSAIELVKTYLGTGDDDGATVELATGPNHPGTFRIRVDLADGQELTGLQLTDILPAQHAYTGITSLQINGAAAVAGTDYVVVSQPNVMTAPPYVASNPNRTLAVAFQDSVGTPRVITGSGVGTIVLTVGYYIPEFQANGVTPVVNPTTGDKQVESNTVSAVATFDPKDVRDPVSAVNITSTPTTVREESLTLQKSSSLVVDVGPAGMSPGDIVEWTLNFNVSDFFAFDNLRIVDVLGDGAEFDPLDPNPQLGIAPRLSITRGGVTSGPLSFTPLDNYTYSVDTDGLPGNFPALESDPLYTGETQFDFDVSELLRDNGLDTKMVGGLFVNRNSNVGPTSATITFRTRVLDRFRETFTSGFSNIDERDTISNTATLTADVLGAGFVPTGATESDSGGAVIQMVQGTWQKTIYAVNGSTVLPSPLRLNAGDEVTYRLQYNLAIGDYERLTISDFLPLPVFRVDDADASSPFGSPIYSDGPAWTMADDFLLAPTAATPASGQWKRGPADTHTQFADGNGDSVPGDVTVTTDYDSNELRFSFGVYDDPLNSAGVVDLLFTVTATGDPFADGLFLTNEAVVSMSNTYVQSAETPAVVQIEMGSPNLNITKGAVATDSGKAVFTSATVGPVAFSAPGTIGSRWAGTVNSQMLATTPIDSNVSGVDAGDIVTFAIVVENVGNGRRGAYDVQIRDALPAGFVAPPSGFNIRVSDGTGAAHTYTAVDPLDTEPLFGDGINIDDPGPTGPTVDGTNAGSIDAYNDVSGRNILIITYDAMLSDIPPASTHTNTATLFNYAADDGGRDFTASYSTATSNYSGSDQSDDATATVPAGALAKSLVVTSESSTVGANVTIGEIVRYRLEVVLPESTSDNVVLTDLLPTGMQFLNDGTATIAFVADNAVTGSILSSLVGPGAGLVVDGNEANVGTIHPTFVIPGGVISLSGNDPRFQLGTLTIDENDDNDEFLVVEFNALVLNDATNDAGDVLANSFSLSSDDFATVTSTPVNVTIREPQVVVTKSIDGAPPADAADSVAYRVQVTNSGSATAFEVQLTDVLPAALQLNVSSVVIDSNTGGSTGVTITSGNTVGDTSVGLSISSMPVGATVEITFTAQTVIGVTPSDLITNQADVVYTSLPGAGTVGNPTGSNVPGLSGASDGERDGSTTPAQNDYTDSDTASFTTSALGLVKSITSTSETHTTGTNVAIGEIVRYRLTTRLIEGTHSNLRISDALPTGLSFLNDGTATVAFVSDVAGAITSTVLAGAGLDLVGDQTTVGGLTPTFVIPGGQITAGATTVFSLGNVINNDSDGNSEFMVIEFNALVTNGINTNNGNVKPNSYSAEVDADAPVFSNSVDVTIREPLLTLDLTLLSPAPSDAGDTANYQVVLANTGSTTAFDVRLTDLLPSQLTLNSGSVVVTLAGGASTQTIVLGNGVGDSSVEVTIGSMPVGSTVTVTFNAVANTTIAPNVSVSDTANVTYTSLPGAGTASNPTGSSTPGASGAATGERDGSGTPSYNDYSATDTVAFNSAPVIPVKSIAATSEASTSGSNLTIGEIIRYRLATRLPEGTSTNFRLVDTLPTGLTYLNDGTTRLAFVSDGATNTIVSSVGALSGAGLEIVGDNASTYASLSPTFALPGSQITTGASLTFTLGDLTNLESDADDEYVIVEFNALVANTAANVAASVKNNSYSVLIGAAPAVTSGVVSATIVEPSIVNLNKGIVGAAPTDAQDFVTYRVTFSNTGSTTAFNVQVADDISALPLSLNPATVTLTRTDGITTGWTNNSTSSLLDVAIDSLPVGVGVTLEFTAQVLVSASPSQTVNNTANVTFTSLPGPNGTTVNATGSSTPGVSGAADGERNGSGVGVNTYLDSGSTQFTLAPPSPTKTIVATSEAHTTGTNVAIGEIVRYRLQTSLSEGTTTNLRLVDTLPTGMSLLDLSQVMVSWSADADVLEDATLAGADNDAIPPSFVLPAGRISVVGQTITFDLGTLVNQDDDAGAETVTLEFNALVGNVAGNVNNTSLSNQFVVSVNGTNLATSSPVTATVRTPSVTNFTKSIVGASPVDAGDVVQYRVTYSNTGTTTAFDSRVLDDLASLPLTLNTGTVVVTLGGGAAGIVDASDSDTLDITISSIPVGGSVTIDYEATVTSAITPLQSVTNTASLAYTSLPGANGTTVNATGSSTPGTPGSATGERDGSGGAINNYRRTSSRSFTAGAPTVLKSINSTSIAETASGRFNATNPDVAIGETVTYRVTTTLREGTSTITITDNVPAGMSILSASVISIGSQISGSLLSVGSPAVLSDVNVVDGLNDRAVFSFGTVTNSPDNVSDALDQIVIEVVGRVENVVGNISGTTLTNTAVLNYGSGSASSQQTVDVVVADLQIAKTVVPTTANSNRYRLAVTHTAASQAPAFDVILADLMSNPALQLVAGSVTIDAATTVVGATITSGNGGGDTTVAVSAPVFELGQTLIVTFDATIPSLQAARIDNTASVNWDSNPLPGPSRTGLASATRSVGAIGDLVFFDTDGDGSPDVGEPGIPSIAVQLTWAGPDGILATAGDNVVYSTTTNSAGGYQFRGLPDGVYRVDVTPPSGASPTGDADGGLDNRSQLTLVNAVAAINNAQDFGYRGTGAVGDNVFSDVNLNGIRDVGEIGIGGILVTLAYDADGNGSRETLFTTTTNSNGDYRFDYLLGGSYEVSIAAPVGSFPTTDLDGDTVDDTSHAFTLGAGETRLTEDFGLAMPADLSLVKSISPNTPPYGGTVTFTIEVSNAGPFAATGVSVEDIAPSGFTSILGITPSGSLVGNTITWSGLSLAVGATVTLSYTAVVTAGGTFPGDYTNSAQVTTSQQYDPDSTPDNDISSEDDQDSAVALVPVIHLESYVNGLDADTAATAAGIRAGTNATLTYVVTNPGGVALTNVTVVDDNGTTGTTSDDFSPTYVSGDTNGNLALEPGEVWTFSATRPIRYGLTASMPAVSGRSIADANVVVTDEDPIFVEGLVNVGVLATDRLCANNVRIVDLDTGATLRSFAPFETSFSGGVSVAYGDLTGDGIDEMILGAGAGRQAEIRVFTQAGVELTQYRTLAWPATYTGGIEVEVGDYDGDGDKDLIAVPKTGAVQVRVFANTPLAADPIGNSPALTLTPAFPVGFVGGADVAVGNLIQNPAAVGSPDPVEIVVGSGKGIRSTVLVYSRSGGGTWQLSDTLLPFTTTYTGGVNLSAGRINSDAIDDLIVSPLNGNNSTIEVWDGNTTDAVDVRLSTFTTFFDLASRNSGVYTYPLDANSDGIAEKIVAVQGLYATASGPRVYNSNGVGGYSQLVVPLAPRSVTGLTNVDPSVIAQFYSPPVGAYGGSGEAVESPLVVTSTVDWVGPVPFSATNVEFPADVDGDGIVSPADALRLVNLLNELGAGFQWSQAEVVSEGGQSLWAAPVSEGGDGFADVDADGILSPRDVLWVIAELNLARATQGDGEAATDNQTDASSEARSEADASTRAVDAIFAGSASANSAFADASVKAADALFEVFE